MGTPQFAVPSLELLANSRFCPALCITQPDKPQGRNRRLQPPAVKIKAQELGIEVIQPEDINDKNTIDLLKNIQPDIIVTVAYGEYLKKGIRLLPELGCLNLHPSLLPRYRGSAPINFALFNGEEYTGNTIFKIVSRMDAGPIYLQQKIKISPEDCYTSLSEKLSHLGAENILEVLNKLERDEITPSKQKEEDATYSYKLTKEDFLIDWNFPAGQIFNQVLGLAERPGAVASFRGKRIKIIETEILEEKTDHQPGTIIEIIKNKGIKIACIDNNILIKRLQPSGKNIMTSHAFSLGARIENGERFEKGF